MVHDVFGFINMDAMGNDQDKIKEPNISARNFFNFLKDVYADLYPSCEKISKWSFIMRLLHLKSLNQWNDISMDILLKFFKEVLLDGALVLDWYYKARKIIRDLGLDYTKIDACQNDCILYWKEHGDAQSCPKCKLSQWKSNGPNQKKIPYKVL